MTRESYPGVWRYIIVIVSMIEVLCFTGVFFGWGAFVYVLKDEGFLVELCQVDKRYTPTIHSTNSSHEQARHADFECDERDARFNLYYTLITSLGVILILLLGHTFTKCGTRTARLVFISTYGCGCLCIAMADTNYPWLICVGGILMIGSGYVYVITATQFNLLFPNHSSTIVGLMNGMKSSSPFMQQFVKIAHENGVTRRTSYFFLLGMVFLTYLTTIFLFPSKILNVVKLNTMEIEIENNRTTNFQDQQKSLEVEKQHSNNNFENKGYDDQSNQNKRRSQLCESGDRPLKTGSQQAEYSDQQCCDGSKKDNSLPVPSVLARKTIFQHMRTHLYIINVFWYTIHMFRTNYFFGTINPLTEEITKNDDKKVSYYTDVLSYTMAGSIILSVVIGLLYDWQRNFFVHITDEKKRRALSSVGPLMCVCLSSVLLSTMAFVKKEYVLYLLPVIFTLFKSLYSTIANAFLVDMFPIRMYGSLYCVRFVVANIFSLIQYAIFEWSLAYNEADLHVNIFILCLCLATFVHPASILFNYFKAQRRASRI